MSDMHAITKLESLPNEILIECFEYLNAIDILNAFDYLNSRFNNLIRNIPLRLSVDEVQQSVLIKFGLKMLLNPQIKERIQSLKLSCGEAFNNNKTLFSFTSLDELPNLRALIFSAFDLQLSSRISSILPLLPDLRYFRMKNSSIAGDTIFIPLAISTVQKLSIRILPEHLSFTHRFTTLIDITISSCFVENLCYLLEYTPVLQYLKVDNIEQTDDAIVDDSESIGHFAVRLKRLIIQEFQAGFDGLERILERAPNLKVLIISSNNNLEIADACTWHGLIQTYLPLLKIFKFKFDGMLRDDDSDILNTFEQFHTDFWREEHQWYVEYVINKNRALVYTVPYISNEYEILPNAKRWYYRSANSIRTFANVTDLTICPQHLRSTAEYYFPNVKSLQLEVIQDNENQDHPFLRMKHIKWLKTMINVRNLTHLTISLECPWRSSAVMLELLKEALCLSSLKIDINALISMCSNGELCEYLSKSIKTLDFTDHYYDILLNSDEIVKLCQIFSNLEVFRCYIGPPDNLAMVLDEISKLPYLKVFSYETDNWSSGHRWTGDREAELDLYSFTIECQYHGSDFEDWN